jgi:hypothetical protein
VETPIHALIHAKVLYTFLVVSYTLEDHLFIFQSPLTEPVAWPLTLISMLQGTFSLRYRSPSPSVRKERGMLLINSFQSPLTEQDTCHSIDKLQDVFFQILSVSATGASTLLLCWKPRYCISIADLSVFANF